MQSGYVFKKDGSWFLRYRDTRIVGGVNVRKQICHRLARFAIVIAVRGMFNHWRTKSWRLLTAVRRK